jgi:hypothetical protein
LAKAPTGPVGAGQTLVIRRAVGMVHAGFGALKLGSIRVSVQAFEHIVDHVAGGITRSVAMDLHAGHAFVGQTPSVGPSRLPVTDPALRTVSGFMARSGAHVRDLVVSVDRIEADHVVRFANGLVHTTVKTCLRRTIGRTRTGALPGSSQDFLTAIEIVFNPRVGTIVVFLTRVEALVVLDTPVVVAGSRCAPGVSAMFTVFTKKAACLHRIPASAGSIVAAVVRFRAVPIGLAKAQTFAGSAGFETVRMAFLVESAGLRTFRPAVAESFLGVGGQRVADAGSTVFSVGYAASDGVGVIRIAGHQAGLDASQKRETLLVDQHAVLVHLAFTKTLACVDLNTSG